MPKGQQRTNREKRKPKADKPKPGPRAASFQATALGSTMSNTGGTGGKKKT